MKKIIKQNDIKHFLIVMAICSAIALSGVLLVKPPSYGAVLFLLFILLPAILILFVSSIVFAISNKLKSSLIALVCCLWFPVSFFGITMILTSAGLLGHTYSDGTDLDERIIVAIKENRSSEEFRAFYEAVPQKVISNSNGTHIENAEGVCYFNYFPDKYINDIVDIGFCNDATDEQKKKIRDEINSNKVIYKVFENLKMEDIDDLPLEKAKVEPKGNVRDAKTAVNVEGSN